jgi:16S rRNA (guanine1207-N2)-methyltransferase
MTAARSAVYGAPPRALADPPFGAIQLSPLIPGAEALEAMGEGSLDEIVMLAPPATAERKYALAAALKALKPGAALTAMAPKDKGGSRLGKDLESLGCAVSESAKAHHRICVCERPAVIDGLEDALAGGAPRQIPPYGLWSQPGVFSWDRLDPGTALLAQTLPPLAGRGADFGCGLGYLARAVLTSPSVKSLALIDIDRRAVDCARRNVEDARATFHWADVAGAAVPLADLDVVVMNPPFHDAGSENRGLGQGFIRRAAAVLHKGGALWMVANRHLPYEKVLGEAFAAVAVRAEAGGFKVFEARK